MELKPLSLYHSLFHYPNPNSITQSYLEDQHNLTHQIIVLYEASKRSIPSRYTPPWKKGIQDGVLIHKVLTDDKLSVVSILPSGKLPLSLSLCVGRTHNTFLLKINPLLPRDTPRSRPHSNFFALTSTFRRKAGVELFAGDIFLERPECRSCDTFDNVITG
ncbi:hypothetical protein CEXT_88731 [Caerostris extrusa]|uniref:Uncharacterized protein n=1 Tax=Caerostris extrusa TaxID=172846 RepID=A0AAV4X739_CAEEX|nr:hypothetical protein CEXT_88731 [Caerostris extrusa]